MTIGELQQQFEMRQNVMCEYAFDSFVDDFWTYVSAHESI